MPCPTCRTQVNVAEINLVRTGQEPAVSSSAPEAQAEEAIEIVGSYSTKVGSASFAAT